MGGGCDALARTGDRRNSPDGYCEPVRNRESHINPRTADRETNRLHAFSDTGDRHTTDRRSADNQHEHAVPYPTRLQPGRRNSGADRDSNPVTRPDTDCNPNANPDRYSHTDCCALRSLPAANCDTAAA